MSRHRWGLGSIAVVLLVASALTEVVVAPPAVAAPLAAVGDVFVADSGHDRVVKVPADGGAPVEVGSGFDDPQGITVDDAGNVWVADTGNDRVVKLPADGGPQVVFATDLDGPQDVLVQPSGQVLIADTGHDGVWPYSPDGVRGDLKFDVYRSADPLQRHPIGLATEGDSVLIVYEGWNGVWVLSASDGIPVGLSFEPGPAAPGGGLAVGPDGTRYIPDTSQDVVFRSGPTNEPLGSGLLDPEDVALTLTGDRVVADTGNDRVVRITADGVTQTPVGSGFSTPSGVAVFAPTPSFTAADPPRELLVGEPYSYRFTVTAPAGAPPTAFSIEGQVPTGLTLDPVTGTLSGTPSTADDIANDKQFHFLVRANNPAGGVKAEFTVHLRAARFTAAAAPPSALVGVPYAYTFAADGHPAPTFSIGVPSGGNTLAPPGLTLDPVTGVLSGTPTEVGRYSLSVVATNEHGYRSTFPFVQIDVVSLPTASVVTPAADATYTAGAVPNLDFSCAPGQGATLVSGLAGCRASIDGGAPVAPGVALAGGPGEHTVVVTAARTDGRSTSVTRQYSVVATGAPAVTFGAPADGATYSTAPNLSFSCTAASGQALQAGLAGCHASVDGGASVASGSPSPGGLGSHTVVVTATQTDGRTTSVTHHYVLGLAAVGDTFVADSGNDRVVRVPAGGGAPVEVGSGFSDPRGIFVDFAGNVWVADTGNDRIVELPADGGAQVVVGGGFNAPRDVTVTPSGQLWVADTGNDRVVAMNTDGSGANTLNLQGRDMHDPVGLGADPDSNVYVLYQGQDHMLIVPPGQGPREEVVPRGGVGIAIDPLGKMHVPDPATGQVIRYFGLEPAGAGLVDPGGVSLSADGDILVADTGNDRVLRIPGDGGIQTPVASGFDAPSDVAVYAPPPTFTAADLPTEMVTGLPYSYDLEATAPGGRPPVFRPRTDLGDGITLDPVTGVLSGTPAFPSVSGGVRFDIALQVENRATATVIRRHMTVRAARFTAADPPLAATVGVPYSYTFAAEGNPAPTFTYRLNLPPGLMLDPTTGVLSGTPTRAGNAFFIVDASNEHGFIESPGLEIHVAPPPALTAVVVTPAEGATFRIGTVPNLDFACTAGPGQDLAVGLDGCSASVDGGPALASGAPLVDALGQHTVVVTGTQVDGQTTTVTRHYTVTPSPTVTVVAPVDGAGYLYDAVPNLQFSCAPYAGSTLAAGLAGCSASVDGGPPVASGTSLAGTSRGSHTVVFTATQTDGVTVSVARSFDVRGVVLTTPTQLQTFRVGFVPAVEFSCSAFGGTLESGLAGCSASIDGGPPVPSGTPLNGALGTHTVVVRATQTDGFGDIEQHAYSVDTALAPVVSVVTPAENATYAIDAVPVLDFSCTAGEGGTLANGLAGCSASIDGGAPLADGAAMVATPGLHHLVVTANQVEGQTTRRELLYTVTATAPTVVIVTPPDGASYAINAVPNVSYSCSPGVGGELFFDVAGCTGKVDGSVLRAGDPLPATVGTHTVVVTALQTDFQTVSVTHHYTVTATGPSVFVSVPRQFGQPTYPAASVPNFDFICSEGPGGTLSQGLAGCSVSVDGGAPLASGTPLVNTVGVHTYVVTAAQTDGQTATTDGSYAITEAAPPTVTVDSPVNASFYRFGQVPNLAYSCAAGQGGTLLAGFDGCSASIDGGPPVVSGVALPGAIGSHEVVVTAVQTDGQTVTHHSHYDVFTDPTVMATSPAAGATFTAGSVPAVMFSCEAGPGGTLLPGLDGCSARLDLGDPVASGSPLAGSVGQHRVDFKATQTDGGLARDTRFYTVVAGASPSVSLMSPADGATFSAGAVPALSFTCSPSQGGTLAVGLDGCSASVDGGAAVASGAALAGGVGAHSVVVTATQTDGQHVSVTHGYTVVAVGAPSVVVTSPADGASFSFGAVPVLDFACSPGAGGTLADCSASVDGGAAVASGAALAGSVGAHSVVVTATQTDGQHASVTHGYTVTAVGPTVSLTSPADGATFTFGSVPDLDFACSPGDGATLADCSASVDGGAAVADGAALAGSVGAHSVVVTATQTDGQHASVTHRYTVVAKATQAISFTSTVPTDARVGGPGYTVTATGGASGQPVTFSLDPASSGCALSAASITFPHAGTCVINADQAGTADFEAAARVQQTFTVARGTQTITFTSTAPTDARVGGPGYTVTATGGASGEPVTFELAPTSTGCVLNGATVTFTAPGTCVVNADQAGTADYDAAPRAQQPISVRAKQPQAITFTSTPPFKAMPGGTYTVRATGGASGNPVTFSLDPSSRGCTLSGARVSFVSGGTCVINADQAGNGTYDAAPRAQQTFTIYGPTAPPPPVFPPPLPFPIRAS